MIPDTLRALAHTWLAPISEASPTGDDAAADERYLDLHSSAQTALASTLRGMRALTADCVRSSRSAAAVTLPSPPS